MSTMITNPNEIEAADRRKRALARINRNIARKFQLNRRQFISGSLATMALAALGLSGCAPEDPAASTGDAAPAFTPRHLRGDRSGPQRRDQSVSDLRDPTASPPSRPTIWKAATSAMPPCVF